MKLITLFKIVLIALTLGYSDVLLASEGREIDDSLIMDAEEYDNTEHISRMIKYIKHRNYSVKGDFLSFAGTMSMKDCLAQCTKLKDCKIAIYHHDEHGCYLNGYGATLVPYLGIDAYQKTGW